MVSSDVPAGEFEMRYSGTFDLDYLYTRMRKWYADRKYFFQEKVHKFKPPELELEWWGQRKETGYRKIITEMKFARSVNGKSRRKRTLLNVFPSGMVSLILPSGFFSIFIFLGSSMFISSLL